jgi:predicted NBD/HSP70 family sugar kinase
MLTIAEQKIGLGQEKKNFAVLSIGSGLGSGLVLNGDLHRGHNGAAGEVFWVPFGDPRDKRRESTNPSGDSIADIARNLRKNEKKSTLKEPYSMIEIIAAAKEGDLLGKAIVAEVAERIALYAGAISAITDVELIILSGGIGRQANFFLAPIKELLKEVLPVSPQILVSSLGADAILIGALQMATIDACEFTFLDRRKIINRDIAVSDIG